MRYSEDLDLDICTIQQQTLKNKVDKILSSPALLKLLKSYGINQLVVTSPKQTQTTQRWKIQIHAQQAEIPYPTKIEFSRRNNTINGKLENVSIKICQAYRLSPLRLSHYALKEAIEQKVLALALRSLTQARDIFDLYHLLHIGTPMLFLKKNILAKAEEALFSIRFKDFKSQVVSFLEPDKQKLYNDKNYWETIENEVFHYLNGLEH